jgi:two-component system, NtrC family, sensor kinase
MAIMEGAAQVVSYVNPALCLLIGKENEEIVGNSFAGIFPDEDECLSLLDRAYRTGKSESHTRDGDAESHSLFWSYEIWAVKSELLEDDHPVQLIFQVTETGPFHQRMMEMNGALLASAMRQHELMESADELNAKLHAEMKERKLTQAALLRSELLASAGRLAASIAHEINNPLAAAVNSLFLARTTAGVPDAAREFLEVADGELMRIAHIARQTLGFYREFGDPTSNSASALMASVVDLLQSKIRSRGATVEQQCDEGLQVMGVAGELRQVLANLLANSLDAIEKNGIVKIRCSGCDRAGTAARCVRITVADNGAGIDGAAMKKIFEPFFTTKGTVGTGLGLWVCKELIEKNGGSIRVRSNTDGERRGTTFSVVLPEDTTISAASA